MIPGPKDALAPSQTEFWPAESKNEGIKVGTSAIGRSFQEELRDFDEFGAPTRLLQTEAKTPQGAGISTPTFVNEFWTAAQRAANSLHEISYRACFKAQLPRFFIQRLSREGDAVYDPFMGRGTTLLESALLGRIPVGCDINPLSARLVRPRLDPPLQEAVERRLSQIPFGDHDEFPEELLVFYHPETLKELSALKKHLIGREATAALDGVDEWIWMVALNRLTGHSVGYFSVYTLPPNQATSLKAQRKINQDRQQTPPRRSVPAIIARKSKRLLGDCDRGVRETLSRVRPGAAVLTGPASATPAIADNSVALVVTSPPFLNIVDYAGDNWLRCWFNGTDPKAVVVSGWRKVEAWQAAMTNVFRELFRVVRPGGHVAFEVGEVRGGAIKLEKAALPCGLEAGFEPLLVMINDQTFTKTANCWGVDNNSKGTNTNRIILFRKN